jgi:hypothetical protein
LEKAPKAWCCSAFWTTWGKCLLIDRSDSLHLPGLFSVARPCAGTTLPGPALLVLSHTRVLPTPFFDVLAVWCCLSTSTNPYSLPRRSSSALVAISLAKAAVARIAGALSCGIQVLSSLHLAAVLVYTRKVGMVQDTADASALTLSSSVGLRILDGIPVLEEHMQGGGNLVRLGWTDLM